MEPKASPEGNARSHRLTVAKLEPGPGDTVRVSLQGGEAYLVAVSTIGELGLGEGRPCDPAGLGRLAEEDRRNQARLRALRILAARPHSEKELRDKLLTRGHRRAVVEAVLEEFRGRGWLDDEAFARSFTEGRLRRGDCGPSLIARELARRGIAPEAARRITRELIDPDEERRLAWAVLEKRRAVLARVRDRRARAGRIARYLERRGFSSEVIREIVESVFEGWGEDSA